MDWQAGAAETGGQPMNPGDIAARQISLHVPRASRVLLSLLARLQHGTLRLVSPGGQIFSFPGELPGPDAELRLSDWGVFTEVMRSGDIGFAEAYIDGRWDTPDLAALLLLAAMNRAVLEKALYGRWWGGLIFRLRHMLNANSRGGAKRNIHAHYDLGNDFYRAWLDRTMTYSSALFEGQAERTLEEAQVAKYERILATLDIGADDHVLEIGCGWGGFAEYAARTRGCRVLGITLSAEQLRFAGERIRGAGLGDRVGFALTDYRDVAGKFDHVVSIEMFEAVGERYWPAYFSTVRDRLRPGGGAVVQTITIADELFAQYRRGTDFIQQYVFPGGMLPSPDIFRTQAQRAGLRAGGGVAFGPDYAETLKRWRSRYARAAGDLRRFGFDSRFERLWNFYLAYCEAGFRAGSTDVMQVELWRD
jgi:cyclopropane-fatty-acyl-phospholipid synthase